MFCALKDLEGTVFLNKIQENKSGYTFLEKKPDSIIQSEKEDSTVQRFDLNCQQQLKIEKMCVLTAQQKVISKNIKMKEGIGNENEIRIFES